MTGTNPCYLLDTDEVRPGGGGDQEGGLNIRLSVPTKTKNSRGRTME